MKSRTKARRYEFCAVLRRKLVTRHPSFADAKAGTNGTSTWVTEECGTPLFSEVTRVTGECPGCRRGDFLPTNYRTSWCLTRDQADAVARAEGLDPAQGLNYARRVAALQGGTA